jgi:hypothetical protein
LNDRIAARRVEVGQVTIAYAILAAAFFLPVLGNFSTHLIGPPEDNLRYLWTLWWGHGALRGDIGALLWTDMIFHPEGTSLLYNDYSWYNLFAALPLRLFLGAPATYNLLQLHAFVLAGLGAYLLCREFHSGRLAAFAGGFIFAFSPMHVAQSLHHMNIASVQWIPFFALFFLRSLRGGGRRDRVLAALFFLLTGLCSWNHLIFTGYFVAAVALRRAWTGGAAGFVAALRVALHVTVPPLLLLSVWLVPMAMEAFATDGAMAAGHDTYVVDALAPVVPHYGHLLSGVDVIDAINDRYTGVRWESVGYLGIAALALAGYALARGAPAAAPAALGAAAFLVLAMGAELHVNGNALPIPLPYRLLEALPLVSNARVPGRAMVYVYLFLAILVAAGLQTLLREHPVPAGRALAAIASALLLLDYYTPVSNSTRVALPASYAAIAADEDHFAILELPLGWRANNRYMMYQTFHGVPIVGGQLPRKTGTSSVDALRDQAFRVQKDALIAKGVKYIVVDETLFSHHRRHLAPRYRSLFQTLGFETVYDTGGSFVVRID